MKSVCAWTVEKGRSVVAGTHNTLLSQGHDTVLDPYSPAAHPVGEHHVRKQSVSNDSYLMWPGHSCLWVLAEVLHDLICAAGLLHSVGEDNNTGRLFDLSC